MRMDCCNKMDEADGNFIKNILCKREKHGPLFGQIELTYRCNLNCIYCYCKGSEDKGRELSTKEWKDIIDQLQKQGCIALNFTGGEPFVREDFLELYSYAKKKGFIVSIFTNAQLFNKEIVDYLLKSPPYVIEVTLNGITQKTYESITQVEGSFVKAIRNIKFLAKNKLPLILKTNCMKHNKHEIIKIKKWVCSFLGTSSKEKSCFKYTTLIFPRLNGEKSVLDLRLSYDEIRTIEKSDADLWNGQQTFIQKACFNLRKRDFLYTCGSILKFFYISPYGRLKFCAIYDKLSVNLRENSFKDSFKALTKVLSLKYKTDSKCRSCRLRTLCTICPAKAFLETGDEESPVDYYCHLGKEMAKEVIINYIKPNSPYA